MVRPGRSPLRPQPLLTVSGYRGERASPGDSARICAAIAGKAGRPEMARQLFVTCAAPRLLAFPPK